jgi:hypothetical protein
MPEIYPKMTRKKLQKSARKTSQGKGRAALPGVRTDAKHAQATDKCGYQANRDLAKAITSAVRAKKKADKHGAKFILGWRLYPNKEHPAWNGKGEHSCGCGCGCST